MTMYQHIYLLKLWIGKKTPQSEKNCYGVCGSMLDPHLSTPDEVMNAPLKQLAQR